MHTGLHADSSLCCRLEQNVHQTRREHTLPKTRSNIMLTPTLLINLHRLKATAPAQGTASVSWAVSAPVEVLARLRADVDEVSEWVQVDYTRSLSQLLAFLPTQVSPAVQRRTLRTMPMQVPKAGSGLTGEAPIHQQNLLSTPSAHHESSASLAWVVWR